jgi:hypothetical protein
MYREGQSPLHARHIVRTKDNENAVSAVRYLYDKWIHYTALAFGLQVEFMEGNGSAERPIDINAPFQGKLQYQPPAF